MIRRLILAAMLGLALVAPAAVSLMAASARAADGASVDRVPVPRPPKGQGDQCVADTAFMRRNHMAVLMHQRDATMHEGIRTKTFSMNGCVSCHAVAGKDGKAVSYDSNEHFCRSCHTYAAVSIDCFTCHASRPGEAAKAAQTGEGADHAALAEFLRSREQ
jgi:predicted CXXCH cytochrome family protein